VDMTAPLALKGDVLLIPVSELDSATRRSIDCHDDDVALSRPRSRGTSTVVDPTAAALLEQFRTPRTIVEAVVRFSRDRQVQADDVLDDAYHLVRRMVDQGFIIAPRGEDEPAEAADSQELRAQLVRGDVVAGAVVRRLLQLLEDTEVYVARHPQAGACVLKIQRAGVSSTTTHFAGEARVLELLGGDVGPRLIAEGLHDGRPFLLMEHCSGIDAASAAEEHRRDAADGPRRQVALMCAIAGTYARLHELGVVHGDVHPRNVLVGGDGRVRLIDFGLSANRSAGLGDLPLMRGGVAFFQDPETAEAALYGRPWPPLTPAGEQYSIGALLYLLLTGVHYLDFSLGRLELLREIAEQGPVPLMERGLPAWPAMEAILFRALAKRSEDRYPSVAGLADALERLQAVARSDSTEDAVAPARLALDAVAARILDETALDGAWFTNGFALGPTASVSYGAAGVAYVLGRVTKAREDPALMARADAWLCRADTLARTDPRAFLDPGGELAPDIVGTATPFHTRSGIAVVRATLGEMFGDAHEQARAVDEYLSAVAQAPSNLDVTLGQCSTILGALQILQTIPPAWAAVRQQLVDFGNTRVQGVWADLRERPSIPTSGIANLGMAHGWAGFVHTALCWHGMTGAPLPDGVTSRLEELADLAEPSGRGLTWPWELVSGVDANYMSGWCNGSAGHVVLWTTAARTFGDERHLDLAIGAACDVWDTPDTSCTLCCGLAGRSYALLAMYRLTRDRTWLGRARSLGYRAVHGVFESGYPHSLYKGQLVLPVLAADLADPDRSCQPFFDLDPRGL
jgi:eukaryotic-like serine/threonine-protein kinase